MTADTPSKKPWSGRFTESTDAKVEAFTASVHFDRRLYPYDIQGSIAHATMLAHVGVLEQNECDAIVAGLNAILADIDSGRFQWSAQLEDVHMNIEAELTARIGEVGKKLHTARSRNDQVATDMRLYLRDQVDALDGELVQLQAAILTLAEQEADTALPGFTHLQGAQPVTLGHHLMAWFEMLARDRERLADGRIRINRMPLGAAALAGTTFPIDREMTAELLGFDVPCANSLDAVSDRDFAIEFCATAALIMVHLSRIAEELILWSSAPFGFIELGDAFCTGSSIMPQKKNPDVPELVRGKSSRVVGNLTQLLVLMKAQPLAYNRDNQEDKEPVFDTVDTVRASVSVFADLIPSMQLRRERMREAAAMGFATATDLADYLVRKGVPFRDAHELVGRAVQQAQSSGRDLAELKLDEFTALNAAIEEDVYEILTVEGSLAARDHPGGTAPAQVRTAIAHAKRALKAATDD